jgi:hypothetical protein
MNSNESIDSICGNLRSKSLNLATQVAVVPPQNAPETEKLTRTIRIQLLKLPTILGSAAEN